MSAELVLLVAALVVSFLLLTWLLRVVKATLRTALALAGIALLLQLLFGIGPGDLGEAVSQLLQGAWTSFQALQRLIQP
jgi:hypothetical protein